MSRTIAPFGRRLARLAANEAVGPYRVLWCEDGDGPGDPRPGQFYMLAAEERWGGGSGERPYLPRAFSYCRVSDGRIGFFLEAVGPGTERLGALEPGEHLWLTGPLGTGFTRPERGRPLLVGGGIGVAPLLCWQDELGPDASVLLGFRTAEHARAAGLFAGEPAVITDDAGLVTDLLGEELERGADATVYACGPPAMLEAVRAMCAARSVPAQLAMESGMACGFGACMGCVVPTSGGYVRLCVDGPVLDAAELDTALVAGAGH